MSLFNFWDKKHVAHSDESDFTEKVKQLLIGRRIVEVERLGEQTANIVLDNGTELYVEGNEGCGGCGNGWYFLDELNGCENAITNVECTVGRSEENSWDDVYHLFVFADNKKINCLQFSGSDNGYYGTGYDLYVKVKEV